MQLIYRGSTYDYTPSKSKVQPLQTVRNSAPAYHLTYRGVNYSVDRSVKLNEVAVQVESHKLIYRGAIYFKSSTVQKAITTVSKFAITA
jgi:Domain of unknown function (DUF4278)